MQAKINLVKSFTQNPEQGSPTGVVLDADYLSDAGMQYIAAELGFAESVFVRQPEQSSSADYHLRFFAPKNEVDLCGHATIAAFHMLKEQGQIRVNDSLGSVVLTQQTRAGSLEVVCHNDGRIVMRQNDPEFTPVQDVEKNRVCSILGLIPTPDLRIDLPLEIVSTGTPKLLVPVSDTLTLSVITPDMEAIKQFCERSGARGIYPFAHRGINQTGFDFVARQFNPLADDNEDPITGVAAGALGAYAGKHDLLGNQRNFIVRQGFNLGMGGDMFVDISDGVRVGGYAVTYGERLMQLPDEAFL